MLELKSCPKVYSKDQDKAVTPEETVAKVKKLLDEKCSGVLKCTRKIDTGRLGIPVFISECGDVARDVMPTRKQMGKGASVAQAEASALMELVERFSFSVSGIMQLILHWLHIVKLKSYGPVKSFLLKKYSSLWAKKWNLQKRGLFLIWSGGIFIPH